MERTLTVIGKGRTATTPDTIQIELCLKATDKNYETVSLIAVKQYNEMCDCLHKVGIAKGEIKTTDYSVTTEYEMRRNTNNTNVRTFVGYTCTHLMKVKLPLDMKHLSDVLSALSTCSAVPSIDLSFTCEDQEAIKQKLLISAAEDAKIKAQVLADASGIELVEICSVQLLSILSDSVSPTRYNNSVRSMNVTAIEMTPDVFESSCEVSYVWSIAPKK